MKSYKLGGWSSLMHKYLLIENYNRTQINLDEIVTNANKIEIYPRYHYFGNKLYHKTYESEEGFTVYQIFDLCVKTYWTMIKELYNNDKSTIEHLSLVSFDFDVNTNRVYPNCDS